MNGFQQHIIVGNLGGDPELRYLPDGTAVANFSVAVNQRRGQEEITTWFRVAAWGKLADAGGRYNRQPGEAPWKRSRPST
ncbi:MAG: single-stranded DNA-binding protein [Candidatus Promineifilaceae bacterium]